VGSLVARQELLSNNINRTFLGAIERGELAVVL
jgi:hypothetical protein